MATNYAQRATWIQPPTNRAATAEKGDQMFVPAQYREPDLSWVTEMIQGNPLALMVSNGSRHAEPRATHVPIIQNPDATGQPSSDLAGASLLGHMNRANPHWTALETGTTVLLVFTGPHAYVSPTIYGVTPAAPTWDFTTVHVRGVLRKIQGIEATLEVVRATVRAFEGRFGAGWDMSSSQDYFRRIVPGVGAFQIEVTGSDAMFKLSQEQPSDVRERVRESFATCGGRRHADTAEWMSRLPPS